MLEQFTELTPDPEWAFAHLTQAQTSYATHGYHRYPAKFIPQLALSGFLFGAAAFATGVLTASLLLKRANGGN